MVIIIPILTIVMIRILINNRDFNNKNNRVMIKNGYSNDSDENSNKIVLRKSSPYCNPCKSSDKNKAKRYLRHSVQRSVTMASLFPEYFSNIFLSVNGLIGQSFQSM